ncbi:unnamed protein product [Diatraea saccharalis]|uniref:Uncharacterized protein n=1 Tax=Diatraea saccharalis TaxID=40085 RepID=A0A9N9N4N6_9NEOP|nr:unnamed protein product [Diatraea saccharalis]
MLQSSIDELDPEIGRDRRSSASSEAGDVIARETRRDRELLDRLREENERLKTFASQQREHIDELSSEGARLRSELAAARIRRDIASQPLRPRTAPAHDHTLFVPK